MCPAHFAEDTSKFSLEFDASGSSWAVDSALSRDVVAHLAEDAVLAVYTRRFFNSPWRFVIICSSNISHPWTGKHVRYRQHMRWIETDKPRWYLHSTIKSPYPYDSANAKQTAFSDFYVFVRQTAVEVQ
jgi:hypothetical protein